MHLFEAMKKEIPQLKRGQVWCLKCGKTRKVDAAQCMRDGWPQCCGETMTVDSPEERAAGKSINPKEPK